MKYHVTLALPLSLFAGALIVSQTAQAGTSALSQQLKDLESFQVIAHRGASGHAPESSMAALELAHGWGVDYLELDIQMTADGELVAFHDDTLERTSNGEGHINDHTLAELKALDAGSWFNEENPELADEAFEGAQILTLEEVFDRFGQDARYYLETKSPELNPGVEEGLVRRLEAFDMIETGRVLIQSFDQESLLKIHELNADIPLIQLVWYSPDAENDGRLTEWTGVTPSPDEITDADFQAVADYAVGLGTNYLFDDEPVIGEAFVQQAQDNGLAVHVYTVNDIDEMQHLIGWGVNGLFTDYADRLIELTE
ncbi:MULTISPECIES: glycerophosphodiester phosphodiesterase [unclassified Halomonas]|uniref:glycerophosphodiester phosphodiesterase n=1 Tax=unclassified Halomonas TaxID=2609666 RepID=UPI0020A0DDE4|nr:MULTISPECIES: glycerophosphodiester phosphodiesterase [unclassified Halomonas]MCP1315760.1 glycerophosphodiester phosphodiesterase [Halomonas sp. 707D7]MCP1325195.1 glycerophosphodiester phosphodiesterase [Halomonas sp. 707D4]